MSNEKMTQEELVKRISKILLEMDGKELADLYNREFAPEKDEVTYFERRKPSCT
jgi:hypothetical protein